ncbi:hypothetical protein A1O1_01889 [Capronia coronata CBS 617.96]|uniref:Uncharacterized protein n=1 Tax=Capronia coronata CBS 617.96 TaxID=1182541 RepID=W9YKR9_9EURO|nr:uncharacterized protein A1O1_01889 [Capronia coronata CBS 617.96]EXJ93497.1 hypothetical protein A1O1_01889 [Capronia coronata CBS 617.96]
MSSSISSTATRTQTQTLTLPSDNLDDLIYLSRTGDLSDLQNLITNLCQTHACSPSVVLASAIDVDEDGLGSRSSLLHYPAANGNLEVVEYLLSLIVASEGTEEDGNKTKESLPQANGKQTPPKSAIVNHQNVSGNTPLHWAGMNGHLEVVKALVRAGADAGIVNAAGRDAVVESECSAKEGAVECADWMLKNCEGLEKGVGSAGGETNNGDDHGGQEEDVVMSASMDADGRMVVEGQGEGTCEDNKGQGTGATEVQET